MIKHILGTGALILGLAMTGPTTVNAFFPRVNMTPLCQWCDTLIKNPFMLAVDQPVTNWACDDKNLRTRALSMMNGLKSPLYGEIQVLKSWNERANPTYSVITPVAGVRDHSKEQCMVDLITDKGEATGYYGWKKVEQSDYITVQLTFVK